MIVAESSCAVSVLNWASVYLKNVVRVIDSSTAAVIFDVDETLYFPCPCQHPSPPPDVLRLYHEALQHGFQIYFITARIHTEVNREQTWNLLHAMGFTKFKGLFLMPEEYLTYPNASSYKALLRDAIQREGVNIVLNLGNRFQDLMLLPPFQIDEEAHETRKELLLLPNNRFFILQVPDVSWVSIKFPTHGCEPWE